MPTGCPASALTPGPTRRRWPGGWRAYGEERFARDPFGLDPSDPEFSTLFSNFAFDEVIRESKLDDKTRFLAILATLLGCQGADAFCAMVPGP